MDVVCKPRNVLEGLVREGSFKWLFARNSLDKEFEGMGGSPSDGAKSWIPELSPAANSVLQKCSLILGVSPSELQVTFNKEASEYLKQPARYARNFFEYFCFRTIAFSIHVKDHLADKKFRRLTHNMMVAWEIPSAASMPSVNINGDVSVGLEAFSRIAPAIPVVSNAIIGENLFEALTASTNGRLQFSTYNKYLVCLERLMKKLKSRTESSILSAFRSSRGEKILEVDGTVTSRPVLEHVGISTWPGRLTLTDYAIYFESLKVVYDKPKIYDLSDDSKQLIKSERTGPWGARLFDKAIFYNSIALSEPAIFEFPELRGHTRRDYWLAIVKEIFFAHKFIKKYQMTGAEKDEALSKAVLGILRVEALREMGSLGPLRYEALLMFNLCDQLPGGDLILESLVNNSHKTGIASQSSPSRPSGYIFGSSSNSNEEGLVVGDLAVGEITSLERAVKESINSYKKVMVAQETIDGVKVDGIDTNLAVMQELLSPVVMIGGWLLSVLYWDDTTTSSIFCLTCAFIIHRDWLGYVLALFIFAVAFIVFMRGWMQGKPDEFKVKAPPAKKKMEQLMIVQNAITQVEELLQDVNIILLKGRALLLSIFPQASKKFVIALVVLAFIFALVPSRYIILMVILEIFTRYSPFRKACTERWMRRLRDWWFSIPAAPICLTREGDEKKSK